MEESLSLWPGEQQRSCSWRGKGPFEMRPSHALQVVTCILAGCSHLCSPGRVLASETHTVLTFETHPCKVVPPRALLHPLFPQPKLGSLFSNLERSPRLQPESRSHAFGAHRPSVCCRSPAGTGCGERGPPHPRLQKEEVMLLRLCPCPGLPRCSKPLGGRGLAVVSWGPIC